MIVKGDYLKRENHIGEGERRELWGVKRIEKCVCICIYEDSIMKPSTV
jgi:hypothetical protein